VSVQARRRGFTLIELMVALAIVALLLMLGVPSFTTFVRNSEIRSTSESIINGLRAATAEAANRNRPVTFELASATGADWKIWVPDEDDDTKKLTIQEYSKKEAGANTQINLTPAGQLSVRFDGLGRVVNPGTDDHIQLICIFIAGSVGDACLPVDEYRPLQIIVDDSKNPPIAGKPRGLRMCDPDPALAKLNDPRAC